MIRKAIEIFWLLTQAGVVGEATLNTVAFAAGDFFALIARARQQVWRHLRQLCHGRKAAVAVTASHQGSVRTSYIGITSHHA